MWSQISGAVAILVVIAREVQSGANPYAAASYLEARAFAANAPHGYAPQINDCPSNEPTIRSAGSLADEERSWLQNRRPATLPPMRELLGRLKINGLDTDAYIDKHKSNVSALPNIGIAISGGGYRAMLNGAGVLEAFDSRTPHSTSIGHLGGVLQSTTYLSGLSGGSWLVGSLFANNFTSVAHILSHDTSSGDSGDLWQFGNSIFEGPDTDGIQLLASAGYYATLVSNVHDKKDAGFETSVTDYWGRALSFQLVNATDGGPSYTFSSIALQSWFQSGSTPLPFIVADARAPAETLYSPNTTVYTFSPWEVGSEDPTVYAFVPLRYLGTNFTAGSTTTGQCTTGLDNLGFVMGTSSSLFNTFLTTLNGVHTGGLFTTALQDAIAAVLTAVGKQNNDLSVVQPNPFYYFNNNTNRYASKTQLTLVDGGEDGQNVPLHPLIQPNRAVDVVFAVDSSADTNSSFPTNDSASGWPGGASLVATYVRSQSSIANGTAFPSIPGASTFFNLGLNNRPTFFGCDASNITGPTPLIVYLPNAPYVYASNISTFDLSLDNDIRDAIVLNGYNLATQGNGSIDHEWPTCVGCAILSRSLSRTNTVVPEVCNKCFDRYCWNGATDPSDPKQYIPSMKLKAVSINGSPARTLSMSTTLFVASLLSASWILA